MTATDRQRIRDRATKALAQAERRADELLPDPDREPKLVVIDPTAKREKLKLDINSAPVLATLYGLLSDLRDRPRK